MYNPEWESVVPFKNFKVDEVNKVIEYVDDETEVDYESVPFSDERLPGHFEIRCNGVSRFKPSGREVSIEIEDLSDTIDSVFDVFVRDPLLVDGKLIIGNDTIIEIKLFIVGGSKGGKVTVKLETKPAKQKKRKPKVSIVATVSQPKKKKGRGSKATRMTAAPDAYMRGLNNSLDPLARGCKFGEFPMSTDTYMIRGATSVVSGGSNTSGTVLFYPSPIFTFVDVASWIGAGTSLGSTTTQSYTNNSWCEAAVPAATLGNTFDTVRIVNATITLKNLQAVLSTTGKLFYAPIVDLDKTIGPNGMIGGSLATNTPLSQLMCGGISPSIINTSAILNLPDVKEVTPQDLINGVLILRCKPISPAVFDFKSVTAPVLTASIYSSGGTTFEAQDVAFSSGAASQSLSDQACWGKMGVGFNGWAFYYTGTPTASTPLFDTEWGIHFEGTPAIGSTVGLQASSPPNNAVPRSRDQIMELSRNVPWSSLIPVGLDVASELFGNGPVGRAAKIASRFMNR
jgi:hypothetical protein